MRKLAPIGIGTLALALAACGEPPSAGVPEALIDRWTSAYFTGDAETLGAVYASDAQMQQGYCPVVAGRYAITEFWRGDLGEGGTATELRIHDAFSTEDVAYITGTYSVVDRATNAVLDGAYGRYSQIWRRTEEASGEWSLGFIGGQTARLPRSRG